MLPEKGHNTKFHPPDPSHDAVDPGGGGADPGRDDLDPRGENVDPVCDGSDPICGALDPIREDHDPRGNAPDPVRDGSDPIRAVLDPRGVNPTDRVQSPIARVGTLDPRGGSFTNVTTPPDRERASPKTSESVFRLACGIQNVELDVVEELRLRIGHPLDGLQLLVRNILDDGVG
jgi:hypothetical protein